MDLCLEQILRLFNGEGEDFSCPEFFGRMESRIIFTQCPDSLPLALPIKLNLLIGAYRTDVGHSHAGK